MSEPDFTRDQLLQFAELDMPKYGDFDGRTIKTALRKLLVTLWDEQDDFSGKRPFGNSDWDTEFARALVRGGAIWGVFDEEGVYLEDYESDKANCIIHNIILEIFE